MSATTSSRLVSLSSEHKKTKTSTPETMLHMLRMLRVLRYVPHLVGKALIAAAAQQGP